jgi:hypothetical protein
VKCCLDVERMWDMRRGKVEEEEEEERGDREGEWLRTKWLVMHEQFMNVGSRLPLASRLFVDVFQIGVSVLVSKWPRRLTQQHSSTQLKPMFLDSATKSVDENTLQGGSCN